MNEEIVRNFNIMSVTRVSVAIWKLFGLLHRRLQIRIIFSIATDIFAIELKVFIENIQRKFKWKHLENSHCESEIVFQIEFEGGLSTRR